MTPTAAYSKEEIARRITELGPWFHNMELGGVWTAPEHFLGDYPRVKFDGFRHVLPEVRGKSVLDIGCNGGFYALEMKRRGAARVVATEPDEDYLRQARFAAEVEGLDIEFAALSVYQVGELKERFDLVIFMGVLYHLRHPLLALDLLHEHVTQDLLLFQSLQRGSKDVLPVAEDYPFAEEDVFNQPGYPKMHFVEKNYTGDCTNWWIPNRACVEAMLRSAGYEIAEHPEQEVYLCRHVALPPGGFLLG